MGTRFYDFTSAFDQVSAPTGSSPTGTSDFVTVSYGVSNYARYIDTIANLKAVSASYRADGLAMWVDELLAWFYFDSASSSTGDDENIITPSAGTGRWLRMQLKGFGAVQDVATSATITAMASSTPVVRLTGSTTTDIQGITAGVGEQLLELYNASSAIVTLKHANAGASAANRLSLQQSADLQIQAGGAMLLRYDKTLTRWVPASGGGGSGGGGGGSSLDWIEDALAPVASFEYSQRVYAFADGETQYLYAAVRVPSTYTAGLPINLRGLFYGNATANTVLMQTVATLIRTGTDAISSTTNQRTSTNSAVTLATTANRPNAFVCDLTSSTGQVNSVSVAAGDLILVRLTRDTATDTSTVDAMFPPYASEVTFT